MTRVAVVGAAGYAGVELMRFVLGHPDLELAVVTSRSEAGSRVGDAYPALAPFTALEFEAPEIDAISARATLAFLAVPHTAALGLVPQLLDAGVTVIDASADYRLDDAEIYEHWYGTPHTSPDLLARAVYGLPEIDRTGFAGASLVACPGCYPTASILAAAPALETGVSEGRHVVVDAKSGVSGAGRTPSPGTHYPAVTESMQPYKVTVHRHTPEIDQGFSRCAGRTVKTTFTPHLVPLSRGLLATVYLDLASDLSAEQAVQLYRDRYDGEPFVTVHEAGRMPTTGEVRGTNRAHIGVAVDAHSGTLVAACAIDNLVKGTSGQAVQCANLVLGYDETAGLMQPGPVV